MSVPNRADAQNLSAEVDRRRLARERALLAQARESVAHGNVVPDCEVEAWLDRMIESDEPLPIPTARQTSDRS